MVQVASVVEPSNQGNHSFVSRALHKAAASVYLGIRTNPYFHLFTVGQEGVQGRESETLRWADDGYRTTQPEIFPCQGGQNHDL